MIRMAKFTVAALVLALTSACGGQDAPVAATPETVETNPEILKVETGLLQRVQIEGEPAERLSLADRMAWYGVPGVSIAVIRDGKIAWAKGYGVLEAGKDTAVNQDTLFQAGSISKPVAAIGALKLVEQGKLQLDTPINDVLTGWKIPDNAFTKQTPVTLRQIMSHSAGLTVHGFPGYAAGEPVPTVQQVLDGAPPANTPAVRVDKLPGESWRYSGGGYTVMQLAMTDVAKQDFVPLMDELVLKPAGMARSSYLNPLPANNLANAAVGHERGGKAIEGLRHTYPEMAAAGLWTTPSDLARMGLALVAAARGETGAILGPDMTKQMLTLQKKDYGLGFALEDDGDGQVFSHGGSDEGFEALFFTYTDGHGGAAIMTNGQRGGILASEIAASLAAAYGWKYGAPETRKVVALTPERAALFTGEYMAKRDGRPDLRLTITAEGDKLWIAAEPMMRKQRFYVASDSTAFAISAPVGPYSVDAAGRAVSIQINPNTVAVRK